MRDGEREGREKVRLRFSKGTEGRVSGDEGRRECVCIMVFVCLSLRKLLLFPADSISTSRRLWGGVWIGRPVRFSPSASFVPFDRSGLKVL